MSQHRVKEGFLEEGLRPWGLMVIVSWIRSESVSIKRKCAEGSDCRRTRGSEDQEGQRGWRGHSHDPRAPTQMKMGDPHPKTIKNYKELRDRDSRELNAAWALLS